MINGLLTVLCGALGAWEEAAHIERMPGKGGQKCRKY
jgi:hypothetical protein